MIEPVNSALFLKISRASVARSCMGPNPVVLSVARSLDEDFVAFALLDSGLLVRYERWEQDWFPVSSRPSEENHMDYFTFGTVDCGVSVSTRPLTSVEDWSIPLTKMQPAIQLATGDRYHCFARGVIERPGKNGELVLSLTSVASASDCRSSLLVQPAPASELVSVVLNEVVSEITLDSSDYCFTFGHVRDRLCDGIVNQIQICASTERNDPVFLPTQVVSGGARGLKIGQTGLVSIYMSGEPPFTYDLLLDGKFLRREETLLHLQNFEERLV